MGVKKGYKETELGMIPVDWEVKELNEILELLTDFEANGSFESVAQNVTIYSEPNYAWYVRATDLENNSPLSKVKYVDYESYKFLKKTKLNGNEILITKRGEIGKVYLFTKKYSQATLAPNLYLLNIDINKIFSKYLFYYLKSDYGQKELIKNDASTTLGALYKNDVKSIPITIPPLPEQQKIATVLSDTDALIAATEDVLAKKRLVKQATLQNLLSGKTRLPGFGGEWERKQLRELFTSLSTASNSRADLSSEGSVGYIHYGDIHTKWQGELNCSKFQLPKIEEEKIMNLNNLIDGDIVMADASEDYDGLCAMVVLTNIGSQKIVAGLHTFLLRSKTHNISIEYKKYLNYLPGFKEQVIKKSTGVTVYSISKTNLLSIEIPLPPLPEQTAIAEVLTALDEELTALEQQLAKYRLLKQGLMQELLSGKTRLV